MGENNGQFKSKYNQCFVRINILVGCNSSYTYEYNVSDEYLLFVYKNKKDKGVVNGL